MTMAQYVVHQSEHGYDLIRIRPIARPGPLWIIGGTMAALAGFKRRTLPGLALAAIGGAMIYYGSEGGAQWCKRVGSGGFMKHRFQGDVAGRQATSSTPTTSQSLFGPSYQNDGERRARQIPEDSVDEASMQSFPASDAPAY